MTAPQRFLANHRNLIAAAVLTPSAVQAVSNSVVETQIARKGTAALKLSGAYTGQANATYDFAILDDAAATKLVSSPVFVGAGSETLIDIEATTIAPQRITVECHSAGSDAKSASVDIEGVSVIARAPGVGGNAITIDVDISGLAYASTPYSLLEDVKKGAGADNAPLDGPQFDYGAQAVGSDNVIPAAAHRIAFEGDRQTVYVQFKKFVDGAWKYYFVPSLQNDYPAGTKILFVSGSYSVAISNGGAPETHPGIVTVYDFLNAIKTSSTLCDVDGVIANDRTSSGQAAKDFPVRTKARALLSTGTGSKAAKGFVDVSIGSTANTELVTAECIAIDSTLDPFAHVGHEAWDLAGSVSGALGKIYTGDLVVEPTFALRIPQKLPPTSGNNAAQFSMTAVNLQGTSKPDICFFGKLGPNAVAQTITLTYTRRKSTGCECDGMPLPILDGPCLGTTGTGGDNVSYSFEAQTRLEALYEWAETLSQEVSSYVAGKDVPPVGHSENATLNTDSATVSLGGGSSRVSASASRTGAQTPAGDMFTVSAPVITGWADDGLPASFFDLLDSYETALASIDLVINTAFRAAGFAAWDDALTAWENDLTPSVLALLGHRLASFATMKYKTLLRGSLAEAGISPKGKADASTQTSGDGCWQDFGGDFWTVVGSVGGAYAPLFTNHAYWLSRLLEVGAGKAYYSTHEAGFIINILCTQLLTYGDTITLTIGNTGALGTYQVGDILKLPIIAAAPLKLTGGANASRVQSWYVSGSVVGPLPVYVFDPDAPGPYVDSAAGLFFLLVMGGVAPVAGDAFTFVIEGAHFQWRKNGGAWSGAIAIPDGPAALDSGLSYEFVRGASPSFVTGDAWTFRALQPWSAENVKSPRRPRFFPGTGSGPWTLEAVYDSVKTIDAIAIALHTIPEGASIQVVGGDVVGITDWTEPLTWSAGPIVKFVVRTGKWSRLEVDAGFGSSAAWFFVGQSATTELAADFRWREKFLLDRGNAGGSYQGGVFLGKAINGVVSWTGAALKEPDVDMLRALLRQVKTNNDEPFIFLPNFTRPADALFAQVVEDEIEIVDLHDFQRNIDHPREMSASMTLVGVLE
jgi:hypothetical protein